MSYFDEIYLLRLNRFGTNYQERLQSERELQFKLYMDRSVYKIDFEFNGEIFPGVFEKYKQDETETLHYLLTYTYINIPNGTILELPDKDGNLRTWMVYYLERIKSSGYNRYIMLRMSHYITWTARDGEVYSSWAYLYGQEDNMLKDELRSRSRMDTLYTENLKLSFFILPLNEHIKKDDYLLIGQPPYQEAYVVTGFDIQSSEGIEYVSMDPVPLRDLTPPPAQTEEDDPTEFFWLNGGQI